MAFVGRIYGHGSKANIQSMKQFPSYSNLDPLDFERFCSAVEYFSVLRKLTGKAHNWNAAEFMSFVMRRV